MGRVVYYPLSSSFMAISIILFFVSLWLIMDWSESWGFTLVLVSIIMFISSIVSMTKSEPIPSHMNELAIHEQGRKIPLDKKEPRENKLKMFKLRWYDALFLVFLVWTGYYLYSALSLSTAAINPTVFIILLTAYIVVLVFMIVDILSNETLTTPQQLLFALFVLALGQIGMLAYYWYRRASSHK